MASPVTGSDAFSTLIVERDGPVGWLIFDRPRAANAMDAVMLAELEVAWRALDADPAVRVVVTTGAGPAFQTGLDVVQLARDPAALRDQSRRTRAAELRITAWHCGVTKPVIAAVNGICAGGGLHFVCDADIVIAAATASFVDPHVSIGQVSAFESIGLAAKSPFESVARLALVGRHERLSAERARQLGIVSEVVAADALATRAQELGESIATRPADELAAIKRASWGVLEARGGSTRRG